jgi:hypothetical protein
MLIAKVKLLNVSELPASGAYPPSCLATLFDPSTSDTLTLIVTDKETQADLEALDQFADVALKLRWRSINLASLGGSGKGKAYRLQVVGFAGDDDE